MKHSTYQIDYQYRTDTSWPMWIDGGVSTYASLEDAQATWRRWAADPTRNPLALFEVVTSVSVRVLWKSDRAPLTDGTEYDD